MKNKSIHAAAAAHAKAYLSKLFPGVKFRTSAQSYTGGSSFSVSWTDGPSRERVSALLRRYEYGSFDSMQDLYNYDNERGDIPQVKYAFGYRAISDELHDYAQSFIDKRREDLESQFSRIVRGDLLPGSLNFSIDYADFPVVVNGTPEQYAAYYAAADAELNRTESADDRDEQPAITFSVSAIFAPAASAAPSCDVPAGAR